MLTYLVVGGAGFVGFHLCRRLTSRGHKVHVLDDCSGWGSESNIRDLTEWPLVRHAREDARQWATWTGPMVPRPQAVTRAIWVADSSVPGFERMDLQLRGVDCMLRWATRTERERPRLLVVTGPDEHAGADAAVEHAPAGLDVRRVRLRDVYGPRMHPRAHVQCLLDRVREVPEVVVDPEEELPLLHVEDAVTALCRAVDRAEREPVLDLSGVEVWRSYDLARAIQRRAGAKSEVRLGPPNGLHAAVPSGDDAWKLLGWSPSRTLSQSLREVFAWNGSGEDLLAAEYEEQ